MACTSFNWSRLIAQLAEQSFGIPTDVTFQIVEKIGRKRKLHEMKAHKMILALVSPTFKTMLYSTQVGDKNAHIIKIEDTTAPAFIIMMDAVYNVKTVQASLEGKSVDQVFDVVNLFERYQMAELKEAAKEYLANFPITEDNILEVAGNAKEYSDMFEAEAELLLRTCARFLKEKLRNLKGVLRYVAEHEDQGQMEVVTTLLVSMNDIVPLECTNCQKETCRDGEEVKEEEFREGLVVTNNKAGGGWRNKDKGTGRVTRVKDERVTVESIKPGITQNGLIGNEFGSYYKAVGNVRAFLFSCNSDSDKNGIN